MENNLRLVDIIFRVVVYFIKRIKILSVFTLAGLAIGLVYQYTAEEKFMGTMTAYSAVVPGSIFEDVMEPVTKACNSANAVRKCAVLDIEEELANAILSVDVLVEPPLKPINNLDREYETNLFAVEVTVSDPDMLDEAQDALMRYLVENPYISMKLEQKTAQVDHALQELDRQIAYLDSVQQLSLHLLSKGQVKEYMSFNTSTNTPQTEVITLTETRGELVMLKQQLVPAVPITGLSQTVETVNNKVLKVGVFLFTALFLGILFVSMQKAVMMARDNSV